MEPFGNSTDIRHFFQSPSSFLLRPAPFLPLAVWQRVCRTHWNWNNKDKKTIDNQETVVPFHVLFTIFTLFSPPLKMLFMHGSVSAQVWSVTIQKFPFSVCIHNRLLKTACSAFPPFLRSPSLSLFLYKIAHIQTLAGENSKRWSCQWEHTSKISIREEVGYRHESWKSHFLLKRRAAYS